MKFSKTLVAAALATVAVAAQAASNRLDVFGPPGNYAISGLSANGDFGLGIGSNTSQLLSTATGSFAPITGGFDLAGISANGKKLIGNADTGIIAPCKISGVNSSCNTRQAGIYDVGSKSWTALGSLGYQAGNVVAAGVTTVVQSAGVALSSDGKVAVGQAYFNSTVSGLGQTGTRLHPVVFRDGQVIDLNAAGTSQTGKALSVSGDGSVVVGYKSSSAVGAVWQWNGSHYAELAGPKVAHPTTGVLTDMAVDRVSDNGIWAAGGSVNSLATNYGPASRPPPYTVTYSPATLWNTQAGTGIVIPYDHVIDTTDSPTNKDIIKNTKATVTGVSNAGVVIGTFNLTFAGANVGLTEYDAWIYNAHGDGRSQSFDDYLASIGLGLAPTQHVWNLFSMSADGRAIGGYLFDKATSTTSAFVLHTAAVPEPGTWALFSLALPLLAWRRHATSRNGGVGA